MTSSTRLTPEQDALLKGWLTSSPTGPNRLKAAIPAGWTIAHKTGTGSNGATNDIGLLTPPTGAPIIMAAYFTEAVDATLEQREAVIADAARRALKVLGRD